METKRLNRGSALALVLIVVVLVTGLGSALAIVSFSWNRTSGDLNFAIAATYAAEAAMEQTKSEVLLSPFTDQGNVWLLQKAIPDNPTGIYPSRGDRPVYSGLKIGNARVDAYVYLRDAALQTYRLVARATVGGRSVTLAQDIRARDTFARFAAFVDNGDLAFVGSTIRGPVHSNRQIRFYGAGTKLLDEASAVEGFKFLLGAQDVPTNTYISSRTERGSAIRMPTLRDVQAMKDFASGPYQVDSSNKLYGGTAGAPDAEIEFMGDRVRIRALSGATVVRDGTYSLPPEGVIYVQGNVRSVKGKVSGAVSVATPLSISVTGSITYVDQDGDAAYQLYYRDSPVANNTTNPGIAWKEDLGYTYRPNPAFNPTATSPVAGLMAAGNIEIARSASYNVEMHTALFSSDSYWGVNLQDRKGNLRMFGSMASKLPGWRAEGSQGYGLSGEYIYDTKLLANPPPHWLKVESTFWGPKWRIGSS